MQAQPEFRGSEAYTHAIADVANAVSQRPGEAPETRQLRARAATAMMENCRANDAVEVMLAGHCVMFHEVLIDGFRHTLLGEVDTVRRGTRANLVQMDRSFHACLDRLEERQAAKAETTGDAVARKAPRSEATAPVTPAPPPDMAQAETATNAAEVARHPPGTPTGTTGTPTSTAGAPEGTAGTPTGTAALRHVHTASGVCEQRPPVLRAIDGKDERPTSSTPAAGTASSGNVTNPPVAARR
jgi:hypothetical protein